jgi:phosphodiesterase/alkaline phosphatase D-like protein
VLIAVLGLLVFASAPARAAIAHKYLSQLTGEPGGFSADVCGATVDPATGDLYVADVGHNAIDIFEPAGAGYTYESQISGMSIPYGSFNTNGEGEYGQWDCAVAVSDVTGDVYLTAVDPEQEQINSNADAVVYVFNALGTYIETMTGSKTPRGSFGTAGPAVGIEQSVAVDQSNGDVFVSSQFRELDRFNSKNEYLSTPASGPGPLTAVSSGDLYGSGGAGIIEFNSSGEKIAEIKSAATSSESIAVDSAGNVYVTNEGFVHQLDPAGELEGLTGPAAGKSIDSVAVNSSGDPIVAESGSSGGVVDVDGTGVVVPTTTLQAPSSVSSASAVAHGSVNPAGLQVTSCEFEYGTTTSYGKSAPCEQTPAEIGSGTSEVPVTAELTGLALDTTYYYRLNAADANGASIEANFSDETFTTPGPPRFDGESAEVKSTEKTGQTHATLHAQITPEGAETAYHFEYGTDTSYGTSTTPGTLGSGRGPAAGEAELSGLKLATTYHYRVVASNECEVGKPLCTVYGPDQTFTTAPALLIEQESVANVADTSATLGARVDPLGSETSAYFQYGTVSCAASPASCTDVPLAPGTDVGAGEGFQALSEEQLQGLAPGTVYYYRVIASNVLGTVEGEHNEKGEEVVHTFTTQTTGSFALPDNRQWELVSPPNKHGAVIEPIDIYGLIQSSSEGDAFTYITSAPTAGQRERLADPRHAWAGWLVRSGHRDAQRRKGRRHDRQWAGVPVLLARPVAGGRRTT